MVWHTLKNDAHLVKRGLFWICKGGSKALFWFDAWDGNPPILFMYPHLQTLYEYFITSRWDKVVYYMTLITWELLWDIDVRTHQIDHLRAKGGLKRSF